MQFESTGGIMNNISIARETIKITKERKYTVNGLTVELPDMDYGYVNVYSPAEGRALIEKSPAESTHRCRISVTNEDSFQAAARYERPFVMNFANAHSPGGGFMLGANAQEEALCRCSTLFESISGKKASEMYVHNNTRISSVESDYMLLSDVCVFRNNSGELMTDPFTAGVITVPAPNRMGAALLASSGKIEETMKRRIRIMLMIARENNYRNLVLGAWGCGAFRNKPENVSEYFRKVLIDEHYGQYFSEVCFAVYGSEDSENITAFRKCFSKYLKNDKYSKRNK